MIVPRNHEGGILQYDINERNRQLLGKEIHAFLFLSRDGKWSGFESS